MHLLSFLTYLIPFCFIFQNKSSKYWPDKNQAMDIGPCTVTLTEENVYCFYVVRKLCVENKEVNIIVVYLDPICFGGWNLRIFKFLFYLKLNLGFDLCVLYHWRSSFLIILLRKDKTSSLIILYIYFSVLCFERGIKQSLIAKCILKWIQSKHTSFFFTIILKYFIFASRYHLSIM